MKFRYATGLIILLLIPLLLLSQGRRDEANAFFDCIAQEEACKEKVQCYIELSRIFRQIDKDSSLLFAEKAYDLSNSLGYQEGMADALYKKCLTLDTKGEIIDATEACRDCLAIADSINDSTRMAKAYYHLSSLFADLGEMNQANEYLLKALHIFQAKHDTNALVAIYNELGSYYDDLSLLDSAAFYYHKAINYAEAINWTGPLGRIMGNLGKIYDYMDDHETARKYLLLSLSYDQANNDLNNMGSTYSRLGGVEVDIPDYNEAMRYYILADSAYREAGNKNGVCEVYVNRSIIYNKQGKYDQAIELLDQALKYFRSQAYTDGILAVWLNLSESNSKKGMVNKAIAYQDSCEKLAREVNNPKRLQGIYEEMYIFYNDQGDHEKALSAYLKYDKLEDSIYKLEKIESINELLIKYEKEKDQLQIITLENENLQKAKQRNFLLMLIGSIVILGVLLIFFLIYKHRKNRIIGEQKIRQLEEEKKHMAARFLVEGEERERKRMAMELHDNLGVLLSATKMQFSEISDKAPENKELVEKASKYLEQASTDVRKISHNLMPGLLTKLGLFEALEELLENLGESDKLEAFFEVVGPKGRLPENTEIMIYRIVQEMVNNTLKHSEANSIDMTIVVQPDEMNISYSDNGKGFEVEEVLKKKTMGMQNIQSRVKFMDGMMNIDSNGHGAVFRICIPLKPGSCEPSE